MNRLKLAASVIVASLLAGCGGGGGGGGGSASLIGRVLNVETGGPAVSASIQGTSGSPSTAADATDGSFTLTPVGNGTTQCKVLPGITGWPLFTFTFPAASGNTSIGDLWVGPELVTVHGRVLNSSTSAVISGAAVTFGGQNGVTAADGTFNLTNVAYSSTTQSAFWGIVGSATASGFFKSDFNAAPHTKDVSNVVDVGDILLTPSNDPNPPGTPYNVTGRVLPIGGSSGTVVTLMQGSTALRIYNVGADGKYFFWIVPGSYTVTFQKISQTAPTQNVTVTTPNQTVTVPDVTLQ